MDCVTLGFDRIANESQGRHKRAGTTAGAQFRAAIHPNLSFKVPLKKNIDNATLTTVKHVDANKHLLCLLKLVEPQTDSCSYRSSI